MKERTIEVGRGWLKSQSTHESKKRKEKKRNKSTFSFPYIFCTQFYLYPSASLLSQSLLILHLQYLFFLSFLSSISLPYPTRHKLTHMKCVCAWVREVRGLFRLNNVGFVCSSGISQLMVGCQNSVQIDLYTVVVQGLSSCVDQRETLCMCVRGEPAYGFCLVRVYLCHWLLNWLFICVLACLLVLLLVDIALLCMHWQSKRILNSILYLFLLDSKNAHSSMTS